MQSNRGMFSIRYPAVALSVVVSLAWASPAYAGGFLDSQRVNSNYQSPSYQGYTYQTSFSGKSSDKRSSRPFILHQLYDDITYLATQPDFYGIVGGIAAAPSVFSSAFRSEDPEFTELWGPSIFADNFFEVGEIIGNGAFPVAASVISWGIGKAAASPRWSEFGSDLFRSQAVNGLFTLTLKASINRRRPNGGSYSYPSGHTSAAFAAAGTVYADLGKTWGIPAFVLAGYVGLSRLQEGKHYVSDVVAGGILGSYISLKLAHRNGRKGNLTISPLISGGKMLGLSLSFRL
jgi:membrane-associated phospholipid phosphatase